MKTTHKITLISLALAALNTACMLPNPLTVDDTRNLIEPDHPQIGYLGRWDFSRPLSPRCAWTAAGLALQFEGPELELWLDAAPTTAEARRKKYKCYFAYSLDGGPWQSFEVSRQNNRHVIATGLTDAAHTMVLRKLTEASIGGTATLRGIYLATGKSCWLHRRKGQKRYCLSAIPSPADMGY